MKHARELYTVAMEFYDLARIGKAKGGTLDDYEEKMEKAYLIGREAAVKILLEDEPDLIKTTFIRSVAGIAIERGKYREAAILIELALNYSRSDFEKNIAMELLERIPKKYIPGNGKVDGIAGTIALMNMEESTIKFKEIDNRTYHNILVPQDLFDLVAHFCTEGALMVNIRNNENGQPVLQHIRRAA